jgi:hypothetical protein
LAGNRAVQLKLGDTITQHGIGLSAGAGGVFAASVIDHLRRARSRVFDANAEVNDPKNPGEGPKARALVVRAEQELLSALQATAALSDARKAAKDEVSAAQLDELHNRTIHTFEQLDFQHQKHSRADLSGQLVRQLEFQAKQTEDPTRPRVRDADPDTRAIWLATVPAGIRSAAAHVRANEDDAAADDLKGVEETVTATRQTFVAAGNELAARDADKVTQGVRDKEEASESLEKGHQKIPLSEVANEITELMKEAFIIQSGPRKGPVSVDPGEIP